MTLTSLSAIENTGEESAENAGSEDRGLLLARPIPFGFGVAPGTRLSLDYPGEQFDPFLRLSLLEPAGPSFWAVEPGRLFDDYVVEIPEVDVALLDLANESDVVIFVLVSPGKDTPTVNLFAPIIVNRRLKLAAQVILEESGYSCTVAINAGTARPVSLLAG